MGTPIQQLRTDGGARRDRTADLLHAMQALSQLSYSPTRGRERYASGPEPVKQTGSVVARPQNPRCGRALGAARRVRRQARLTRRGRAAPPSGRSAGRRPPPDTATRSGCATLPSADAARSATASITSWTAAGVPVGKRRKASPSACKQRHGLRRSDSCAAALSSYCVEVAGRRNGCSAPSPSTSWHARAARWRRLRAAPIVSCAMPERAPGCARSPAASCVPAARASCAAD